MTQAQRDIRRKLRILNYAEEIGNVSKACRYFGISRETFYLWKRAYQERGKEGLINSKPCPENPSLRTPPEIEEKILYLRRTYPPRATLHRLVSGEVPRYQDFWWGRLWRAQTPRPQPTASQCKEANRTYPALRKTGPWPSYSGGCQISKFQRYQWKTAQTVSIHRF